jgi:hypothetical protein
MDRYGGIMEGKKEYGIESFGKIPNSEKVKIAYALTGNAIDLTKEANDELSSVLKNKKVSERQIRGYLQNASTILRVAQEIIEMETWRCSDSPVPF